MNYSEVLCLKYNDMMFNDDNLVGEKNRGCVNVIPKIVASTIDCIFTAPRKESSSRILRPIFSQNKIKSNTFARKVVM